jgi:PKD repeat protein
MLLTVLSLPYAMFQPAKAQASNQTFSFGASGDFGSLTVGTGVTNLKLLQNVNPNFFLGLGSFSYTNSTTGDVWCSQFKSYYNGIQIIPGDRDTGGHNSTAFGETHSYERYVTNCPLTLGVPITCGPVAGNCYGKEYYFDYPPTNPIARFIFAAPKIYNITGICRTSPACSSQTGQPCAVQYGCWQYNANDMHYNWTENAIDDAHARGMSWVIVATNKLCMSSSEATCSMGLDFFNMLVRKKVDLIIQAHDDAYERSKQIGFNAYACPSMNTNGNGYLLYNAGCIVDQGSGNYTKAAGTVVMVQGAWINDLYGVNGSATSPSNTAEAPYFAKLMGKNTPGAGLGFVKYTVSSNEIDVKTYFTQTVAGTPFSDNFSIGLGPNPAPSISWSPLGPSVGQPVSFTATARGGVGPYSFTWDFGDGDKATGASVNHVYVSERAFNVSLTATDSANRVGSSRSIIGVGSWNNAVACNPTETSIENTIGSVSIERSVGNSSTTGADYSGGGFELAGSMAYGSNPTLWPFSKRSLSPQCLVKGTPSFVELHNVTLYFTPFVANFDCRTSYDASNGGTMFPNRRDCDYILGVANASYASPPVCVPCYMHRIYGEVDGDWNASGVAPMIPPAGKMIDVQGFVYWDPGVVNSTQHNYSGWELHPFTSWRFSNKPLSVSISASPSSPGVGQQVSFTATVSGGKGPYSLIWDFGDGVVATGTSASHVYSSNGSIVVHLAVTDSIGTSGVSSTTISVKNPGLISVVVGSDGSLYSSTFASSWSSWTSLGGSSASPPALCASTGGRVDLVVRGMNNGIYHKTYSNGLWSANWDSPSGLTIDEPACSVLGNNLFVVVRGIDNTTYLNTMGLNTGTWAGWQSLHGQTASTPVLLATPSANRLDMLVRGANNGIYHMSFPGGVPTLVWDTPGGTTPSAPVSASDGRALHLVVLGQNNGLWYNYLNFSTGSWSSWIPIVGTSPSTPSLTIDSSGSLQLTVRGLDNGIYHNSRPALTAWGSTWDNPGGTTLNSPATGTIGNVLYVMVRGMDNRMYYASLNSAVWSSWVSLPGNASGSPTIATLQ